MPPSRHLTPSRSQFYIPVWTRTSAVWGRAHGPLNPNGRPANWLLALRTFCNCCPGRTSTPDTLEGITGLPEGIAGVPAGTAGVPEGSTAVLCNRPEAREQGGRPHCSGCLGPELAGCLHEDRPAGGKTQCSPGTSTAREVGSDETPCSDPLRLLKHGSPMIQRLGSQPSSRRRLSNGKAASAWEPAEGAEDFLWTCCTMGKGAEVLYRLGLFPPILYD